MKIENSRAKLLLHTCCAPCLTVAEERLKSDFDITIFWYNPNIEPVAEHQKRLDTLAAFAHQANLKLISDYDYSTENTKWHKFVEGLENEPEGGKRCQKCIEFRLQTTFEAAKRFGYKMATTTLTTSPFKDSAIINSLSLKLFTDSAIAFQVNDFESENGYKRSIELSKQFGLYRQKYCGCQYSIRKKQMIYVVA